MKINKFKYIIPSAAVLFAVGMTSCMSDLSKESIDPTISTDMAANQQALYSKCYAGLIMEGNDGSADFTIDDAGKSTLLRNLFNFNECSTDEAINWWSDGGLPDICVNNCLPDNATLKNIYYRLTSNISYCNCYLDNFKDGDPKMAAEIRALRAYNYLLSLDFFGDPSFTETMDATANPKQAHTFNDKFDASKTYSREELLQLGREFMFNKILSELNTAEENLTVPTAAPKEGETGYGCINKATVWLLKSRLYLNAGTYLNGDGQNNPYWDKALEYAEKVINESPYDLFKSSASWTDDNGVTYNYTPYDQLFMGNNGTNGASVEALLPLIQDGKQTKGWGGSLFFIASLWNDKMATVTDQAAGTTGNNWSGVRVRKEFLQKFTDTPADFVGKTASEIRAYLRNAGKSDDRALFWGAGSGANERTLDLGDNSSFYQGIACVKWNNNYSNGGTPHDSYDVDTDFFLLRAAEAYLNAAEAALHLGQQDKADGYINNIRERAEASHSSSDYSLNDLLDERAREFYCEGMRRTDLIRNNQFGGSTTYKWEYKGNVQTGQDFPAYMNVYPLPQSEVDANSNLTQIAGY